MYLYSELKLIFLSQLFFSKAIDLIQIILQNMELLSQTITLTQFSK